MPRSATPQGERERGGEGLPPIEVKGRTTPELRGGESRERPTRQQLGDKLKDDFLVRADAVGTGSMAVVSDSVPFHFLHSTAESVGSPAKSKPRSTTSNVDSDVSYLRGFGVSRGKRAPPGFASYEAVSLQSPLKEKDQRVGVTPARDILKKRSPSPVRIGRVQSDVFDYGSRTKHRNGREYNGKTLPLTFEQAVAASADNDSWFSQNGGQTGGASSSVGRRQAFPRLRDMSAVASTTSTLPNADRESVKLIWEKGIDVGFSLLDLVSSAKDIDLPQSSVPVVFRKTVTAPMGGMLGDEEEVEYDPKQKVWKLTVFPSSRPTGRAEVQMLAQAIHDIILAQRKKKEKEERPWDLFHNGELDVDLSLEELGVWEMAMVELVRQVQVQCSERGVLLDCVRGRVLWFLRHLSDAILLYRKRIEANNKSKTETEERCRKQVEDLETRVLNLKNLLRLATDQKQELEEKNAALLREAGDSNGSWDNEKDKAIKNLRFSLDSEGIVADWNRAATRLTGFRADEVIGNDFCRMLVWPTHGAQVRQRLVAALESKEPTGMMVPFSTKEDMMVEVELQLYCKQSHDGEITGTTAVGVVSSGEDSQGSSEGDPKLFFSVGVQTEAWKARSSSIGESTSGRLYISAEDSVFHFEEEELFGKHDKVTQTLLKKTETKAVNTETTTRTDDGAVSQTQMGAEPTVTVEEHPSARPRDPQQSQTGEDSTLLDRAFSLSPPPPRLSKSEALLASREELQGAHKELEDLKKQLEALKAELSVERQKKEELDYKLRHSQLQAEEMEGLLESLHREKESLKTDLEKKSRPGRVYREEVEIDTQTDLCLHDLQVLDTLLRTGSHSSQDGRTTGPETSPKGSVKFEVPSGTGPSPTSVPSLVISQTKKKNASPLLAFKSQASMPNLRWRSQTALYEKQHGKNKLGQQNYGGGLNQNPSAKAQAQRKKLVGSLKVRNSRLRDILLRLDTILKPRAKPWLLKFVHTIYKEKASADDTDRFARHELATMPEFLFEYFRQQYGTKALVESHAGKLVKTLLAYRNDDNEVSMFMKFMTEEWDLHVLTAFIKALRLLNDAREALGYDSAITTLQFTADDGKVLTEKLNARQYIIETCSRVYEDTKASGDVEDDDSASESDDSSVPSWALPGQAIGVGTLSYAPPPKGGTGPVWIDLQRAFVVAIRVLSSFAGFGNGSLHAGAGVEGCPGNRKTLDEEENMGMTEGLKSGREGKLKPDGWSGALRLSADAIHRVCVSLLEKSVAATPEDVSYFKKIMQRSGTVTSDGINMIDSLGPYRKIGRTTALQVVSEELTKIEASFRKESNRLFDSIHKRHRIEGDEQSLSFKGLFDVVRKSVEGLFRARENFINTLHERRAYEEFVRVSQMKGEDVDDENFDFEKIKLQAFGDVVPLPLPEKDIQEIAEKEIHLSALEVAMESEGTKDGTGQGPEDGEVSRVYLDRITRTAFVRICSSIGTLRAYVLQQEVDEGPAPSGYRGWVRRHSMAVGAASATMLPLTATEASPAGAPGGDLYTLPPVLSDARNLISEEANRLIVVTATEYWWKYFKGVFGTISCHSAALGGDVERKKIFDLLYSKLGSALHSGDGVLVVFLLSRIVTLALSARLEESVKLALLNMVESDETEEGHTSGADNKRTAEDGAAVLKSILHSLVGAMRLVNVGKGLKKVEFLIGGGEEETLAVEEQLTSADLGVEGYESLNADLQRGLLSSSGSRSLLLTQLNQLVQTKAAMTIQIAIKKLKARRGLSKNP